MNGRRITQKSTAFAGGMNMLGRFVLGDAHEEVKDNVYRFILETGEEVEVDKGTYDSYELGDEYVE